MNATTSYERGMMNLFVFWGSELIDEDLRRWVGMDAMILCVAGNGLFLMALYRTDMRSVDRARFEPESLWFLCIWKPKPGKGYLITKPD